MSKFPEPTFSDLFKQKLHEVFVRNELGDWDKAFKISHAKIGDRGYRGCEGVIVCDSKDMRAKRQVVEGVIISMVKTSDGF